MSIWASLTAPGDDEHTDDCAVWEKQDGYWGMSERPCSCGQPDAPIRYQGSHVLPEATDERGGWVDLALVLPHVRFWRDNPDADGESEPDTSTHPPEPFLRFGVNSETVILDVRNVRLVYASLTEWLGYFPTATDGEATSTTKETTRSGG